MVSDDDDDALGKCKKLIVIIVGSFNMHIVRTWKWTFARGQYVAIGVSLAADRTIQYVSA